MFESFYNLQGNPFRLTPDGMNSFKSRAYSQGRAYLRHALRKGTGVAILTGEPGTGKTTLIKDLLSSPQSGKVVVATIVTSNLDADDMLRMIAIELGIDETESDSEKVFEVLQRNLLRRSKGKKQVILVLDEAQNLTADALEVVCWLVGSANGGAFSVQAFLAGQEGLHQLIHSPEGSELKQCVIATFELQPLSSLEAKSYIHHRLRWCGWLGDPRISEGALRLIYRYSQGVPRRINLICGRLLLHGALEEKHNLNVQDIEIVLKELQDESLIDQIGIPSLASNQGLPQVAS